MLYTVMQMFAVVTYQICNQYFSCSIFLILFLLFFVVVDFVVCCFMGLGWGSFLLPIVCFLFLCLFLEGEGFNKMDIL